MSKVKVKRKSTLIDMTAMSDVTVLLLTFFMLTSTFVQQEPVQTVTPSSVSDFEIPSDNVLKILIEEDGKVFMGLDKYDDRTATLEKMQEEYDFTLTDEQKETFRLSEWFGVPINMFSKFLSKGFDEQTSELKNYGIPLDAADKDSNSEFHNWVKYAAMCGRSRMLDAREKGEEFYKDLDARDCRLKIVIKASKDTPYEYVKKVMDTLRDCDLNRYSLVTTYKESEK